MMKYIYSFLLLLFFSFYLSAQDSLTVIFAGDAMMHQMQIDNARENKSFKLDGYFPNIAKEVKTVNISVVNLEVPLGGEPYSGYPAFSAPDEFAVALQEAGFNFFLLANNHCLDRGVKGVARTIHLLDSLGMRSTGIFLDNEQRMRSYPMLLRKNGFRIIMLNYTYDTNGIRIKAPYTVNYIDKEVMAADIAEAKLFNPDFIIANMHWGIEYSQLPSKGQKELTDWLFEQGVDLVVGSHPHVVQPMELRKGEGGLYKQLVVYSLGNFISNMGRENTRVGAMVKVVLCRRRLERYISSARYVLVYSEHYKNERGKESVRVIPSLPPIEMESGDLFFENTVMNQQMKSVRTLLKINNIDVDEYFVE